MTTESPTQVKYVRYNGSLLGGGPFSWSSAKGIESGTIFEVDADGLPKLMAYLNGDDRQRATFTVIEPEYAETLRHCTGCRVYFPTAMQEQRHLRFHEERMRTSQELARLNRLDVLDAEDRETIHALELRIVDRDHERQELRAKVADMGLAPTLADGR
jgi:hypothetical protein